MANLSPNSLLRCLDPGIRDIVVVLNKAGFRTFTSCEGGRGHAFRHATIGFELNEPYPTFQKRLVTFMRSQGVLNFSLSLVTNYPDLDSYVYIESLDLLSPDKKRKAILGIKRKERRLLRQIRESRK